MEWTCKHIEACLDARERAGPPCRWLSIVDIHDDEQAERLREAEAYIIIYVYIYIYIYIYIYMIVPPISACFSPVVESRIPYYMSGSQPE